MLIHAECIVGEFGHNAVRGDVTEDQIKRIVTDEENDEGNDPRAPVVTVMGHVGSWEDLTAWCS